VPGVTPHTLPVVEPTVTLLLVVLHIPPVTPSVQLTHEPSHTDEGPLIAVGDVFTVTLVVTVHPPGTV